MPAPAVVPNPTAILLLLLAMPLELVVAVVDLQGQPEKALEGEDSPRLLFPSSALNVLPSRPAEHPHLVSPGLPLCRQAEASLVHEGDPVEIIPWVAAPAEVPHVTRKHFFHPFS